MRSMKNNRQNIEGERAPGAPAPGARLKQRAPSAPPYGGTPRERFVPSPPKERRAVLVARPRRAS